MKSARAKISQDRSQSLEARDFAFQKPKDKEKAEDFKMSPTLKHPMLHQFDHKRQTTVEFSGANNRDLSVG